MTGDERRAAHGTEANANESARSVFPSRGAIPQRPARTIAATLVSATRLRHRQRPLQRPLNAQSQRSNRTALPGSRFPPSVPPEPEDTSRTLRQTSASPFRATNSPSNNSPNFLTLGAVGPIVAAEFDGRRVGIPKMREDTAPTRRLGSLTGLEPTRERKASPATSRIWNSWTQRPSVSANHSPCDQLEPRDECAPPRPQPFELLPRAGPFHYW